MKAVRVLSVVSCLLLPLLACTGVSQVTPTPTSFVGHREEESMLHAGVFQVTVTMVTHLSNQMMLTVEVENTLDQAAQWSPGEAVLEAYVQSGSE
jgi:hypothetical protein